jgi:hypothetical protein
LVFSKQCAVSFPEARANPNVSPGLTASPDIAFAGESQAIFARLSLIYDYVSG